MSEYDERLRALEARVAVLEAALAEMGAERLQRAGMDGSPGPEATMLVLKQMLPGMSDISVLRMPKDSKKKKG